MEQGGAPFLFMTIRRMDQAHFIYLIIVNLLVMALKKVKRITKSIYRVVH
jgi:hypothetical protein